MAPETVVRATVRALKADLLQRRRIPAPDPVVPATTLHPKTRRGRQWCRTRPSGLEGLGDLLSRRAAVTELLHQFLEPFLQRVDLRLRLLQLGQDGGIECHAGDGSLDGRGRAFRDRR